MAPVTINATTLRLNTRDLMERVKFKGECFIVETFGRPMVVLISFEDYLRVQEHLYPEEGQATIAPSPELRTVEQPGDSPVLKTPRKKHPKPESAPKETLEPQP